MGRSDSVAVSWRRRLAAVGTVLALSAGLIGMGVVTGAGTGNVGAAELPICTPGQEAVTAAGTGTPAPLGNLQGVPADLAGGGVFDRIAVDGEQLRNAATVVAVGRQMGITDRGIRVGIAVAAQQSSLRSTAVNNDWLGLFQQNAVEYTAYQRTDPAGAAWMFYQRLLAVDPGYDTDSRTDWEIGDLVQLTTTGYRFEPYEGMAAAMVDKLGGTVSLAQDDAICVPAATSAAADTGSVFDPGNIVTDEVFYNTGAMGVDAIRAFIARQGENCNGPWCLKNLRVTTTDEPADQYCQAYAGAAGEDAATVIAKVSTACGINPQVMLVTLQKESSLLDRTTVDAHTYDAAWGWHCPDTGPGGTANCDPQYAGFFHQGYGMAKQWSRYKVDPAKYNYRAGQTVDILWNVAESGCGGAPVTIKNQATASLYNYTPYQPNAAALAAYPGTGDKCSAYGNRNFFYMFRTYFGSTGGGTTSATLATGPTLTIPRSPYVSAALAGQTITAPNAQVAKGLAAGFASLGLPYVWGGGGSGAGANNGCQRGGGQFNSCGPTVGFDCSGLTAYVLGQAGFTIPGDSGAQRAGTRTVSWAEAQPGDVVGFPGHVAVYLGTFGGRPYILEASWVGTPVHVVPLTRTDVDARLYRFWDGPSSGTPATGSPTPGATPGSAIDSGLAAGLAAAGRAVSDAVAGTAGGTAVTGSTTRPVGDRGVSATGTTSLAWTPHIVPVPYPTTGATGPALTPRPFPAPVTDETPAPASPSPSETVTDGTPAAASPFPSETVTDETQAPATPAPSDTVTATTPSESSSTTAPAPSGGASAVTPSTTAPSSTAPATTAPRTTAPAVSSSTPTGGGAATTAAPASSPATSTSTSTSTAPSSTAATASTPPSSTTTPSSTAPASSSPTTSAPPVTCPTAVLGAPATTTPVTPTGTTPLTTPTPTTPATSPASTTPVTTPVPTTTGPSCVEPPVQDRPAAHEGVPATDAAGTHSTGDGHPDRPHPATTTLPAALPADSKPRRSQARRR